MAEKVGQQQRQASPSQPPAKELPPVAQPFLGPFLIGEEAKRRPRPCLRAPNVPRWP